LGTWILFVGDATHWFGQENVLRGNVHLQPSLPPFVA
jgi:hypothetical protein